MLFSSFVALVLASTAFAGPLRRFDGLVVEVSGPSGSVKSVDELKFTATVTNSGSEAVKILRYGTILDGKLPTKSFTVKKDGATVPFTGAKIMVSSLSDINDSELTTIGAGETVTVKHDVTSLFDFASAGTGKFLFEPITTFRVAGAEEKFSASTHSKVKATANSFEVEVTEDVAHRELQKVNKRAVNTCTNTSLKSFITASYTEGKQLATVSLSYISQFGPTAPIYVAYFGNSPTSSVTSVLSAVANENSSSRTLNCSDPYGVCNGNVIAYTVISTTNIYYCSIFYNEVPNTSLCTGTTVASRNVRGGTTLHELTHAVAGTDDVVYGCASDQALSDSQSVINADNYNCFTTQVYQSTQC